MKSRTKSPSSPCGGVGGGGAGVGPICPLRNEESAKSYPSISAAYWLPAPTPTPYQVPGKCEKRANELHADEAVSIASRKKGCDVSTSQRSGFPQQMSAVRQ
uniref:Uncharacterized protein n=1 Tax=Anopheles merus TaxID=30066 RepID=A0A182VDK7_ANOME